MTGAWKSAVGVLACLSAVVPRATHGLTVVPQSIRIPQSIPIPHSALRNPQSSMGAWSVLFEGHSLSQWRGYTDEAVPAGWRIAEGALVKDGPVGDLMTRDQFGDFELTLEWRIGDGGNSGIFYRGTQEYDHIYWSAPEYQLLDDVKGADNKTRLTCAGAAYALYPSPPGHLKPVGQWNSARIVARGAHVEHWLNDVKLVEYELWSPDWEAKVKASKFAAYPNFGRAKRGYIALQGDHDGSLGFRNIRIREVQ
jgi:3-keto-disaccharide hydrolase